MKGERGFTLTEVVTVLLLLGILSAVAAPRFFDSRSFQERGLYDEVVAAVRYGQKVAVASGCEVEVQLNNGADAYGLYQRATNCTTGSFTRPVADPAGSGPYRKDPADVPAGLIPSVTISFNTIGKATSGTNSYTIGSHTFTVVGETGYVDAP